MTFDQLAFDPKFYVAYYEDVRLMDPAGAEHHWLSYGRDEGRFPSLDALIKSYEAKGVKLPENFSPSHYRFLNSDIATEVMADWQVICHYLERGSREGRMYAISDARFFKELYFPDRTPTESDLAALRASRGDRVYGSLDEMLSRNGLRSHQFLKSFNCTDYVALHDGMPLATQEQCLCHFVEHGIDQLLPISVDSWFDPAFYRDICLAAAALNDVDAYRHWLNWGLPENHAPNSAVFLTNLGLIDTTDFPAGFDHALYLAANPDVKDFSYSRWRLLQHFVEFGVAERRRGCEIEPRTVDLFRTAADRLAVAGDLPGARRVYQRILSVDPVHTMTLRHYADCLLRMKDPFTAASVYRRTIELGRDNVWTHLNLANCLAELELWIEVVDVLAGLVKNRAGDLELRRRQFDFAREGFDKIARNATALAETTFYERARAEMARATAVLEHVVATAPQGIAVAATPIRSVAIIADLGLAQCRLYRVEQKVEHLAQTEVASTVFNYATEIAAARAALTRFDACIFYRVPATPDVVRLIAEARQAGLPTFYEIDDLMFDGSCFPDSFESYGGQIDHGLYAQLVIGTVWLNTAARLCDYGIASTPPLAEAMAPLVRSGRVFVHRNGFGSVHERCTRSAMPRQPGERVRLFYGTGTKAHNEDFELFVAPALARLLEIYAGQVELIIVGYLELPQILAPFGDAIVMLPPIWNVEAYWNLVSQADVNIAVLKPGRIADCKSEIKWLEAAMFGVPSVVTPTATYAALIEHGVTGMLATTPSDWFATLSVLIEDAERRRAIGQAAKAEAMRSYSRRALGKNIRSILGEVTHQRMDRPRLRLLLVNVFFPPQAVGGATRVVADNVVDLQRLYGDELEIEVFTGTEGGMEAYQLSSYLWNGIRVTGVTTPDDPHIDRRTTDPEMGRLFGAFLDRFKPDLIHFHCVQRLTVSICHAAQDRGIPYLISVHDGWWISDRQFLVDDLGRPELYDFQDPVRELRAGSSTRFERLAQLRPVLEQAARVLAVSESFAALYRSCDFQNVQAVENGVSALAPLPRKPSPDGRVRIAHIGGTAFHKGYPLLKAALLTAKLANLRLTVIDHAMQDGVQKYARWGETEVIFRGKVPQTRVAELYSELDVLLAPSVWPESYGLVVREALLAGCWVVASDRGAIGKDVTPACGFVIDVSTYHRLREVLTEMNDNPSRYLGPIEFTPKLRPAEAQSRELMDIYRGYARFNVETLTTVNVNLPSEPEHEDRKVRRRGRPTLTRMPVEEAS